MDSNQIIPQKSGNEWVQINQGTDEIVHESIVHEQTVNDQLNELMNEKAPPSVQQARGEVPKTPIRVEGENLPPVSATIPVNGFENKDVNEMNDTPEAANTPLPVDRTTPEIKPRNLITSNLPENVSTERKTTPPSERTKKPQTAFFMFMADERQNIFSDNPGISHIECGKIAGERWRKLDPERKKEYDDRYQNEMKEWKAVNGVIERGPYKKKKKLKEQTGNVEKRAPSSRKRNTKKKYTFSDEEDDADDMKDDSYIGVHGEEDDDFENEYDNSSSSRPKRKKSSKKPASKKNVSFKPVIASKRGPPKGISKGPTSDTLVITKEEYKRLAGVEKAFLKVKDLNREMFEIMLYETMKKKPEKVAANLRK